MITVRNIAVRGSAIFLAVAFVAVGASKLGGGSAVRWTERFEQWGYPANAQYIVAALEILGGIGVLIPRWRRGASLILGVLMLGALCTHLMSGEFSRIIPPLVLGGLAFLVCWSQQKR